MGRQKFDTLSPKSEFQLQPRDEGGFYATAEDRDPIIIETNNRQEAFVLAGCWYYNVKPPYTTALNEVEI